MRRAIVPVLVGLLTLFALAGCWGQRQTQDYPDDAIRLRQNIPTGVGDFRLIAVNIENDQGIVVVEPPTGAATNVPVAQGEHYSAAGMSFDVLDVIEPGRQDQQPGTGDGVIVIVVSAS